MKSAFLNSSIRFIKNYKDVDDKDIDFEFGDGTIDSSEFLPWVY